MGRDARIEDWDCPEGLELLRKWAGMDLESIAANMGITRTTLSRWCKKSDAIRAVLYDRKMCKAVEKEVYANCFDRTKVVPYTEQVMDKNGNVQTLTKEKVVVLPADFRAQKYWLNNRNPERWKEKMEVSVDAVSGGMVELPIAELIDEGGGDGKEGSDG